MLRGSRVALLPTKSTKMLLAITKLGVPKLPASQNTKCRTKKIQAQPKWADEMLLIENKLSALRVQLSREKPPGHASFVLGHIAESLSNLDFPITDQTIADMHFKDSFQHPLESLYYSLCLSRPQSVITPTVGLEMARLCGLNERSASKIIIYTVTGTVTFEPSKASEGPDPFIISLLAGRIDVAKLIIEEDKQRCKCTHDKRHYDCWDAMRVSSDAGLQRVRSTKESKMSPLQLISAFGEPEALRYLLTLEVKRKKHDDQWTPLHYAAFFGNVDNMKVLIGKGKRNVNEKTKNGFSPLHLTLLSTESSTGSFDAFSLLLEKGADVNEPDGNGVTTLHLAAEKDDIRFMEALLARDADVKKLDNNKRSPLHLEAEKGNVKALEALLARGSDINGLCKEKKSPLHYAIEGEQDAAAEFLVTKGAKVTVADAEGRTPLHIAISNGSGHIVKLLLAKGVGIGPGDSYLVDAAKIGNVEVIEALIAAGASPCTEHMTPPWFVAAKYDKKEAFPILLAYSVSSVSDKKKKKISMLLQKQYSEELLSTGCAGTVTYGNVLHWACIMGDVKSVSLLIERGANVKDTNCTRGRTALHFAAEHNHVDVIKFLVSKGADIQAKECFGWSPLHSAAEADMHEAMAALVELGADLTVKTKSGKTPLLTYESYCYGECDDGIVSLLTPKQNK